MGTPPGFILNRQEFVVAVYDIELGEGWNKYFHKLDSSIKKKISKKILQLSSEISARHLRHGLDYFVAEAGQFRICFRTDDAKKIRTIFFVGSHTAYEKWLREQ